MHFEEAHALVQRREEGQSVSAAFIDALRNPEAFLAFLGADGAPDVPDEAKLSAAQARAG